MRAIITTMAAGLALVGLSGCIDAGPYPATSYNPGPTTTTTSVVRDAYGNPLSTTQTVRDANGNPVGSSLAGTYPGMPGYYQNVPGYSPQPYPRY